MAVKLFKPFVSWWAVWEVLKTLRSGQLAEGPRVKKFEHEFGRKFGHKNVVALNSGTSALELAYELADIQPGDEVITPVFTCTATNLPLLRLGANIVWADIDRDLNVNIDDVKKKITKNTKAIVFVHFGGNNRGLSELLRLCKAKSITLIEDAAQAVGSDYWGKGDFTCVSLQAIKTLTSGDGGVLICKKRKDYDRARRLRWFGYDREEKQKKGDTDLKEAGYKYHMNDVSAAIALGNLRVIDKIIEHRKMLLSIYRKHGFTGGLWMVSGLFAKPEQVKKNLAKLGYASGQHHFRNDRYTVFGGRKRLPVMDAVEKHYLHLPIHHDVSTRDAQIIAETACL